MPSQAARLTNDYRRTSPPVGQNAMQHAMLSRRMRADEQAAESADQQQRFENRLKDAKEGRDRAGERRAEAKENREADLYERGKRVAQLERWAGPATVAETEVEWEDYQQGGFLPKGVKFSQREALIMAAMNEKQRLAKDKEARESRMAERKQTEVERKNRATERINRDKKSGGNQASEVQKAEYLINNLGYSKEDAAEMAFMGKGKSPAEVHRIMMQAQMKDGYTPYKKAKKVADRYMADMYGGKWDKKATKKERSGIPAPPGDDPLGILGPQY